MANTGSWVWSPRRNVQTGTAAAHCELLPGTVCLDTPPKHIIKRRWNCCPAFWGVLLCSQLMPHRIAPLVYRTAISCSSCWCRGKKPEGGSGFGLKQLLWWLGAAVRALSFLKGHALMHPSQQKGFYLHLLHCEVYLFPALFPML